MNSKCFQPTERWEGAFIKWGVYSVTRLQGATKECKQKYKRTTGKTRPSSSY